ncbi:hypothetical protein AOQ84DRAFT_214030 [Glonium stellatum]|uniref:C2H2-type domain-containing protein n=1 Tax=Glonium stellatum TaxID=574774 RepID=A0A8E2ENU0_9PEZI|nr:hypothetical protein AOQ84DRAFT_214030 [Glonium stellatum]
MAQFFSAEAELALMGDEEYLFPPQQGSMYSPSLHMPRGSAHTSQYYSPHHHHQSPAMGQTYTQQPLWQQPQMTQGHMGYSTYPASSGNYSTAQQLSAGSTVPSSQMGETRTSRSPSSSSIGAYQGGQQDDGSGIGYSRSLSPNAPDLRAYGYLNKSGTWTCAYPGCTSRAVFTRGCDLRKHHKRHTKSFFCRHEGCPQSTGGGFSSKKDLARHEAKHNPGVICEWQGCDRVFSRVDNMRDHVKRIHLKNSRPGTKHMGSA